MLLHAHVCVYIYDLLLFSSLEIKTKFRIKYQIMIMLKFKHLILVLFLVLHYRTHQASSDLPMEHSKITSLPPVQDSCVISCAQQPPPPPPKTVYCSRASSPPPPAKFMYVTGVPGELYRTEPVDQLGYYSSANRISVKYIVVMTIIVGLELL